MEKWARDQRGSVVGRGESRRGRQARVLQAYGRRQGAAVPPTAGGGVCLSWRHFAWEFQLKRTGETAAWDGSVGRQMAA